MTHYGLHPPSLATPEDRQPLSSMVLAHILKLSPAQRSESHVFTSEPVPKARAWSTVTDSLRPVSSLEPDGAGQVPSAPPELQALRSRYLKCVLSFPGRSHP